MVKTRKAFLRVEKQRHRRYKTTRTAIGQQLRYVRRDLKIVQSLLKENASLEALSPQAIQEAVGRLGDIPAAV